MRPLAVVVSLLLAGCSAAPPPPPPTAAPAPQPTAVVTRAPVVNATPTAVPAAKSTGSITAVNYAAITQPLLLPLGALIVAVRGKTPTTAFWLTSFNQAADKVLPAIEGDQSANANSLRTAIMNVRAKPNDRQVLEDSRSSLLAIR
jgi:hypothetical protein